MKIKICGLTDKKEAEYLNKNHVDYAGMVLFFPKSKRNIDIETAKGIMSGLDSSIKKVAVVVSPTVEQILQIYEKGFDIVQIHGDLSKEVYDVCEIEIWKAFNIKDMDEYPKYVSQEKITGFVFDSAEPGSGKAYDHKLLDSIARTDDKLFILAGGLNAENVSEAIAEVEPDVIDVSSSVEFAEKKGKDPEKVDKFVNAIRA